MSLATGPPHRCFSVLVRCSPISSQGSSGCGPRNQTSAGGAISAAVLLIHFVEEDLSPKALHLRSESLLGRAVVIRSELCPAGSVLHSRLGEQEWIVISWFDHSEQTVCHILDLSCILERWCPHEPTGLHGSLYFSGGNCQSPRCFSPCRGCLNHLCP